MLNCLLWCMDIPWSQDSHLHTMGKTAQRGKRCHEVRGLTSFLRQAEAAKIWASLIALLV